MKKVLVILLISASSTVLFAQKDAKKNNQKKSPSEVLDARVKKMQTELELNEDQTAQIKTSLATRMEIVAKSKEVQKQAKADMKAANDNFKKEVEKILTPAQLAKFNEAAEERKEKQEMKKAQKN